LVCALGKRDISRCSWFGMRGCSLRSQRRALTKIASNYQLCRAARSSGRYCTRPGTTHGV